MFLCLIPVFPAAAANLPAFTSDGPLQSDAGYFMVEWTADEPITLEIDEAGDARKARALYSGKNHALFVSGLADGEYTLNLRGSDGAVSDTLTLAVAHQSLNRALWLVGLGALVFLFTVITILRGVRDE